jgi:hypothetical protein
MSGLQNFNLPYREGSAHLSLRSSNCDSVIILLPGQTLPSEMFFDLPIWEDRSCITDRILEGGCDVAHLNPVVTVRAFFMSCIREKLWPNKFV